MTTDNAIAVVNLHIPLNISNSGGRLQVCANLSFGSFEPAVSPKSHTKLVCKLHAFHLIKLRLLWRSNALREHKYKLSKQHRIAFSFLHAWKPAVIIKPGGLVRSNTVRLKLGVCVLQTAVNAHAPAAAPRICCSTSSLLSKDSFSALSCSTTWTQWGSWTYDKQRW